MILARVFPKETVVSHNQTRYREIATPTCAEQSRDTADNLLTPRVQGFTIIYDVIYDQKFPKIIEILRNVIYDKK